MGTDRAEEDIKRMAGMMNSFYYGKAGKADFTPEQMPSNRRQLFFDTLRVRFSGLIGLNLLYILIMLPSLIWMVLNYSVLTASIQGELDVLEGVATAAAGPLSTADLGGIVFMFCLGMIPCMMIAGAFKPGIIYVIRNWSRDQHSFVFSDFKDAVKTNWKQGLLVGFINGASLLFTYQSYVYYGTMAAIGSVAWVIPQMFVVIVCAVWWMVNMVIFPMMITYKMKFSHLVRNCFIIILARLPWSLLIWGVSVAIPFLLIFTGYIPYGMLVGVVLYLIVGFSLTFHVYTSYANACFDRFLNPRIEGASVNMGLRDPADDIDDDEDEVQK